VLEFDEAGTGSQLSALNSPATPPALSPATPGEAPAFVFETEKLSKKYGSHFALREVSLKVPPGIIGLLGPNGAGKTTLIKCLLNLETADSGIARVLGRDIRQANRASREKVGYSPERDCHIPGLAGCEYVTYCGQLSGMSFARARQRAHEILDLVGMGQERYRPVDSYSTGMRQRAKLAQALVHDPAIVFLDEPTNGLDPAGREHTLNLIQALWRELGISVVISSHLLRDIERICDRVIIIAQGRVVEHEEIVVLKNRRRRTVEVFASADADRFARVLVEAGHAVERLPNGRLRLDSAADSVEWLLELMQQHQLPPAEIVANPNVLHELFLAALNDHGNRD
jgi:ABC-2 type transport system ATP-binding protein